MKIPILRTNSEKRLIWLANCKLAGQNLFFGFAYIDKRIENQIQLIGNDYKKITIDISTLYINMKQPTILVNGQFKVIA